MNVTNKDVREFWEQSGPKLVTEFVDLVREPAPEITPVL